MLMIFHAGAHGTNSAQKQFLMRSNAKILKSVGIMPITTGHTREHISSVLDRLNGDQSASTQTEVRRRLSRMLLAISQNEIARERVIMSDDNLFGPPFSLIDSQFALYPDIKIRIEQLSRAVPQAQQYRFLLCIRGYADMLNEIYVVSPHLRPIIEVLNSRSSPSITRTWVDVIEEARSVVGADNLVVWTFESMRKGSKHLDQTLFGSSSLQIFRKHLNPAPPLTQRGASILMRLDDILTVGEQSRIAQAINSYFGSRGDAGFSALNEDFASLCAAQYGVDLDVLGLSGARGGRTIERSGAAP